MHFRKYVMNVQDYPKPGVTFKDIGPLLENGEAFQEVIFAIEDEWWKKVDTIVGLESRGFIFGSALLQQTGWSFRMARKKGKLPPPTISVEYELEYGTATLEISARKFQKGERVLIVDDVLATGGTAAAAAKLVEMAGGTVAGFAFVIELAPLKGRQKLGGKRVQSLIVYE